MTKGQVKWFDPKKGYGFLVGPSGQDVFVHYSHIQSEGFRALKDGEWVEYELVEGEKGWQARDVRQMEENREPVDRPLGRPPTDDLPRTRLGGYEGYDLPSTPEPPISRGYEGAEDYD